MRFSDFETIMSSKRMMRYVHACNGDTRKAMTLYRYNFGKFNNFPTRQIIPVTTVVGNSGMGRNKKQVARFYSWVCSVSTRKGSSLPNASTSSATIFFNSSCGTIN